MNSHQVGAAETSVLAMILYPLCNVRANCRWKKLLLLLLLLATGSHEEGIIWPGAADWRCSKWWSQQQLCKKLFEEDNLAWRLSVWCLAQCCCSSSKSLEAVYYYYYYYYYSSLGEKRKRKTRPKFWNLLPAQFRLQFQLLVSRIESRPTHHSNKNLHFFFYNLSENTSV